MGAGTGVAHTLPIARKVFSNRMDSLPLIFVASPFLGTPSNTRAPQRTVAASSASTPSAN